MYTRKQIMTQLFTLSHKPTAASKASVVAFVDSTWSFYARPINNQFDQGRNL